MSPLVNPDLAERIRQTVDPEQSRQWPAARLRCFADAGVFQWGLPVEFGGREVSPVDMLAGYIELARLCLTTAFIMTQRDAACHRLANSKNLDLRQRLLPTHCSGEALATVGISHLSTSRQHWSRPSVVVTPTAMGFELTGEAPWVTGAPHADLLVTGGTLDNGEQILVAIPTDRAGITVGEPLSLLALNESHTGTVCLNRVIVSHAEVVFGPVPRVMTVGATGGTGSFTTTAVAIGVASRTIDGLIAEAASRPDLEGAVHSLAQELGRLRDDLLLAAGAGESDPRPAAESLRHRANSLASRAAQVYVCTAKGAGFVSGHAAERSLREAMFFQVWSCPAAVTQETLRDLTPVR